MPKRRERPVVVGGEANRPIGGDFLDCLNDREIDTYTKRMLGEQVIIARAFYDVREQHEPPQPLARAISERVNRLKRILLPLHTRNHWASAVISEHPDRPEQLIAEIYDSAPSHVTMRDFRLTLGRLGIHNVTRRPYFRQGKGSNECGLHVILVAMLLSRNRDMRFPCITRGKLPLSPWRGIMKRALKAGDSLDPDTLIEALPRLQSLLEDGAREARPKGPTPPRNTVEVTGGAPDRALTITILRSPLVAPQHARNGPQEVIDVDEITDTDPRAPLQISLEQLRRAGIPISPAIIRWFRARAAEVNQERKKELQAAQSAFDALTEREREARKKEFSIRLRENPDITEETATVNVDRAPEQIKQDPAYQTMLALAEDRSSTYARDEKNKRTKEALEGAEKWKFVTTDVINWVIDAAPTLPNWSLIKPLPLMAYVNNDRRCVREPKANIAAIFCHSHHYYLLTWHDGRLELRDSLKGSKAYEPTREVIQIAGRFAAIIPKLDGQRTVRLELASCELQLENDCAMQAVNNMVQVVTGTRGSMTRNHIRRAGRECPDPGDATVVWKTIWNPQPSAIPQASRTPAQHAPQAVAHQTSDSSTPPAVKPERPKVSFATGCQLCSRTALTDGYCAWHHPKLLAMTGRPTCRAIASTNRPCCELALHVGRVPHCAYHLSVAERKRAIEALSDAPEPTNQRPMSPKHLGDALKPIPHSELKKFLTSCPQGQALEIVAQAKGQDRCTFLCKLASSSGSSKILHGGALNYANRALLCPLRRMARRPVAADSGPGSRYAVLLRCNPEWQPAEADTGMRMRRRWERHFGRPR
jgi:hypothetical protein